MPPPDVVTATTTAAANNNNTNDLTRAMRRPRYEHPKNPNASDHVGGRGAIARESQVGCVGRIDRQPFGSETWDGLWLAGARDPVLAFQQRQRQTGSNYAAGPLMGRCMDPYTDDCDSEQSFLGPQGRGRHSAVGRWAAGRARGGFCVRQLCCHRLTAPRPCYAKTSGGWETTPWVVFPRRGTEFNGRWAFLHPCLVA